MHSREDELREAAKIVASAMRPHDVIRRGLESITADSLHSAKLAAVFERMYDVPQEALDRVIRINPRY